MPVSILFCPMNSKHTRTNMSLKLQSISF